MKVLLYFILLLAVGSIVWWQVYGVTPQEQLEYIKVSISNSKGGEALSNTSESASKLGKVLKGSLEEAQDVYYNGAEAKYE
ncbi:MAG: hypothetical protein IJE43_10465 [Alphaproteobacteria bacterium]|nr:hypothetical protein [Alphaproteobacteria bacterium]